MLLLLLWLLIIMYSYYISYAFTCRNALRWLSLDLFLSLWLPNSLTKIFINRSILPNTFIILFCCCCCCGCFCCGCWFFCHFHIYVTHLFVVVGCCWCSCWCCCCCYSKCLHSCPFKMKQYIYKRMHIHLIWLDHAHVFITYIHNYLISQPKLDRK